MARARNTLTHQCDSLTVYRKPDPVIVARIVDNYSYDAALERWEYLSPTTITVLAREGRRLKVERDEVDTSAVRDCVCCQRPFYSASAANGVRRICRFESTAVFS